MYLLNLFQTLWNIAVFIIAFPIIIPMAIYHALIGGKTKKENRKDRTHTFRSVNDSKSNYKIEEATPHGIIGMLTKVAKSDGRVSEKEAMIIQSTIDQFVEMVSYELKHQFRQSLVNTYKKALGDRSFDSYMTLVDRENDSFLYAIVKQLVAIASIEGLDKTKTKFIYKAANYFMLDKYIVDSWIAADDDINEGSDQENSRNEYDPYEVLGVSRRDSFDSIKRKYHQLVRKFHPDMIQSQGLDNEFIEFAKQKMQEINKAFSIIKQDYSTAAA